MRNQSSQILSGVATADVTGTVALDVNQAINLTFQAIVTGGVTAAGTVKIQGSNDLPPNGQRAGFAPTNWSDIPNATAAIASGVGPLIVLSNVACQFMRAVYTRTSGGTGETITVQCNSVGV